MSKKDKGIAKKIIELEKQLPKLKDHTLQATSIVKDLYILTTSYHKKPLNGNAQLLIGYLCNDYSLEQLNKEYHKLSEN